MLALLLALQVLHVGFLLLHDWIPLGPLNDLPALRAEHSRSKVILGTLISALPFATALVFSIQNQHSGYPHWLFLFLWISYTLLFVGELQAWWVPFFFGAKPARIESYARMFGSTHAFLPARHGIRINTLHILLHTATALTLATLAALTL